MGVLELDGMDKSILMNSSYVLVASDAGDEKSENLCFFQLGFIFNVCALKSAVTFPASNKFCE